MTGRKIIHAGKSKEGGITVRIPATVIVLPEINIEMYLRRIRIFDTVSEFGQQTFFRIYDVSDAGGECIGEFSLLKYIQVWPEFKKGGGIGR